MHTLTLLCRIVDNLGDAGVALRFARQWLARFPSDRIILCTDDLQPFHRLMGTPEAWTERVTWMQTLDPDDASVWGDIIIEMFGTPVPARWKAEMAARNPQPAWINLEYLSAEDWVADCHGLWSTDPASGWKQLFFFPGFTDRSGGLLGLEIEHDPGKTSDPSLESVATPDTLRAFVFAYFLKPLENILAVSEATGESTPELQFHVATATTATIEHLAVNRVTFVPQAEFDSLLASFDMLFVRGEDSFIRAQLAGKPMVWQIYPTDDGAHWTKLSAFFKLYAKGLSDAAREAWWALWLYWNEGAFAPDASANATGSTPAAATGATTGATTGSFGRTDAQRIIANALTHWPELQAHAHNWKLQLQSQCHLIERLATAIGRI